MPTRVALSIIVPVFDEEQVIEETYKRLKGVMDAMGGSYELLFVNDGSRDRTEEIIRKLSANDRCIRLVNFSRNFGHQMAVTAGMQYACGQAMVIIDADLQDPPEVIPEMVSKWQEGFEVVYGRRIKRKGESYFKKMTAKVFYRFLRIMTSVDIPPDVGDFRLIDRKVCDVMNSLTEKDRYVRGLISWAGFRQAAVSYVREERWAGETKYPLRKMIKFAMDAITTFSYKPLRMITYMGVGVFGLGLLFLAALLYRELFTQEGVAGWAWVLGILSSINGMVLASLGLIGEYLGRVYNEAKGRPLYIVRSLVGFAAED